MAQLKMYWFPDSPISDPPLPEGYSISNYRTDADRMAWVECCRNGLVADDADEKAFDDSIASWEEIDLYNDVFYLDHNGEHVGTITAFVRKDNIGDVHMVGLKTEYRGKGLSKYMMAAAQKHLRDKGVKYALLTTDEWRKGAVKGYLTAGFLPVEYNVGMELRWQAVLEDYGVDSVQMLYEDASPYKTIYRKGISQQKIRVGVFGAGRGRTMMNYCRAAGSAALVAVCDKNTEMLEKITQDFGGEVAVYTDFDAFLRHDMDLVVLANYANEHAPYAIRAMKAGKNVLSEVLPVQNLKEAVELIEAVESTGMLYAYAENYCYMPASKKMRELVREGKLGTFEYGEGEYMHNCEPGWHRLTNCDPNHWRNTMSAFYYCTHSLGPLIHISGLRPVSVTGFEGPYNARMYRMGAKAGPFGVEMVTLENGAVLKSLHGVGPARNSIWYSVYGSKGRMESAREDAEAGGMGKLYVNLDENDGDNAFCAREQRTDDGLSAIAENSGHGGSDYYVMHNVIEKLRGNRNCDVIDVYEALDMFLPGLFAYRSALAGGLPMEVPDLRDPAQREKWRNDTACTDPAAAGDMLQPSLAGGDPEIPDSVYETLASYDRSRSIEKEYLDELKKKND
ncbi:MAG: GNAT family N-acetyltransferase [Clostridia bacterium]|nr:GNAT family N-acetyltransferase [Clostridia bacterium]